MRFARFRALRAVCTCAASIARFARYRAIETRLLAGLSWLSCERAAPRRRGLIWRNRFRPLPIRGLLGSALGGVIAPSGGPLLPLPQPLVALHARACRPDGLR